MVRSSSIAIVAALAAGLLCACAYRPPPGPDPLITNPQGTVDTTHGPNGAQTTPR